MAGMPAYIDMNWDSILNDIASDSITYTNTAPTTSPTPSSNTSLFRLGWYSPFFSIPRIVPRVLSVPERNPPMPLTDAMTTFNEWKLATCTAAMNDQHIAKER